jgi:viroplasmin and RNaseH domain-containing protein
MTSTSKTVPSGVQTGFLKGWREAAQKLKGRRRKGISDFEAREPAPAPTLAE